MAAPIAVSTLTDEQINALVESIRRRLLEARELKREILIKPRLGVHRFAEHGDTMVRCRPNGSVTIEILIAGGAHDTGLGRA